MILALETSGRVGSVALVQAGRVIAARELSAPGAQHARGLAILVQEVLTDAKLRPADCRAVAVSSGPGSFTGLRVGVTFAKTFAYALKTPLVEVPTFQVMAEQVVGEFQKDIQRLDVIADAQRGDLFVQSFSPTTAGMCWTPTSELRIVKLTEWLATLDEQMVVQGTAVDTARTLLPERMNGDTVWKPMLRIVPAELRDPGAKTCGRIGEILLERGQTVDPFTLEPRYVRRSAAEEKANP